MNLSNDFATPHLNAEQFSDCVAGLPRSAETEAHLAACAVCRQEVEGFLVTMEGAGAASLAWSQARPVPSLRAMATPPLRRWAFGLLEQALSRVAVARISVTQMSMAAAALVLALGTVLLWHVDHAPRQAVAVAVLPTPGDSAEQIAQDNQLLQLVNVALNSDERSPYEEYGLEPGSRRMHTSGPVTESVSSGSMSATPWKGVRSE